MALLGSNFNLIFCCFMMIIIKNDEFPHSINSHFDNGQSFLSLHNGIFFMFNYEK